MGFRQRIRDLEDFIKLDLSEWTGEKDVSSLTEEEKEAHVKALGIQNDEAVKFLREKIPAPSPKTFYKPEEYWGTTSPFLNSIWDTMLNLAMMKTILDLAMLVFAVAAIVDLFRDYTQGGGWAGGVLLGLIIVDWVFFRRIRKMIEENPYDYLKNKIEAGRHFVFKLRYSDNWAKARYALEFGAAGIGPHGSFVNVLTEGEEYEWQEVPAENEGKKPSQKEYMIVDKATGKEAPLRPEMT